ncbi:MAG: hypothetical protein M1150_01865 [Patescibacteria group bacterium]|nr:hypothetical protein [Patescibacteria group bacterium]
MTKKNFRLNPFTSSLSILLVVSFCYYWLSNSVTSEYTFQLMGVVALVYFLYYFFFSSSLVINQEKKALIVETLIFTVIVILFIGVTGSLESNFFFLLYFLTIGVALLLKPVVSLVLITALVVFYYPEAARGDFWREMIKLFSLLLVAPLSMFFAREYLKVQEQEEKIKFCQVQRKAYSSELERIQGNLNVWTAFQLKGPISVIKHYLSSLLSGKLGSLNKEQKKYIERVYESNEKLITLLDDFERKTEGEIEEVLRERAHQSQEEKMES